MFGRIVLGILIMGLSGAMVYFSADLVEMIGRVSWAEEKLGGTRQMRVLFGFGGIVIGGLIAIGVLGFSNPADINTAGL